MRTRARNALRSSVCALLLGMGASFALSGCNDDIPEITKAPDTPPPPPPSPTPAPEKEKPVYVYSADKFRDPFVQSGAATNYSADAVFDPKRAQVKAVIFGRHYQSAVLTVGNGVPYFVKGGRIFDIMGKTVDGFTAKVFADKVVLLGEADNTYELKIKDDEDDQQEGKAL